MANIEQLKKETDEIKKWLSELKNNVSLSEVEKKNKAEALKNQAEATKKKIENEIHSLESKTDDESKKKKEEAETLLNSFNEIMSLYNSILNNWRETTSQVVTEETAQLSTTEQQEEKKWFFWKIWEWLWNMRSDVTSWDKWKEQPWKNLLYAAWVWITWYAVYKWVKKLRNWAFWKKKKDKKSEGESSSEPSSKKDNTDEEKSFWDKPVWKFIKWAWAVLWVWTGVYYVAHGLYTQNRWLNDLWDRERGKKLEFDAALEYCKWAISNQDNIEWMWYGLDLKYHADTWEIEAYWEKIKIDKNNRKIEWLEINFNKYEHMINTAIVIAYLKKNYAWKCVNNSPFDLNWSWQWDINVATQEGNQEAVDWTWIWGRITWIWTAAVASIITAIRSKNIKLWASVLTAWWALWFAWWYVFDSNNIMNKHMPELDDENWRKNLTAYLNSMSCREAKNQTAEDITESPIKKEVVECMEEIQQTSPELPNLWDVRKIDAIQDPNNPEKYVIKAYKREILAKVTWEPGDRKINILWIDGWNPTIKTNMEKSWLSNLNLPLKEWLYMSCLTWFLLNNYHNKWIKYPWFEYTWRTNHAFKEWIYFSDDWTDTRVYSKDAFQQKMPTLFQEENRKKYLEFLNDWITGENNVSIRKK